MSIYHKAEELNLLKKLKIREEDIYCLYSLVKILEDNANNEAAVLRICRTFMVPTILAIHPENRELNPKHFIEVLKSLNPIAYVYRIAKVVSKYTKTNINIANLALHISNTVNTLREEVISD